MTREEAVLECQRLDAGSAERFTEHVPVEAEPGMWRVGSRLRPNWRRLSRSDRLDRPVKKGERFVVSEDVEALVATHWLAPFSGGCRATLPRGTVLVTQYDQRPGYPGFSCVPEDDDGLEATLAPADDRNHPKYGGYSLSFVLDDIGTKIESV